MPGLYSNNSKNYTTQQLQLESLHQVSRHQVSLHQVQSEYVSMQTLAVADIDSNDEKC